MRILAVDDEKYALAALTEAIEKAAPDAALFACSTAQEAVSHVAQRPCEVAFLDIRLRGMTGLELALKLKNVCPRINIVFVTGHDEYLHAAIKQRCSGYLFKPVQAEQVREELGNLRYPVEPEKKKIHARTFGNFDLFVGDLALEFETSRSKELLAFLIDRRGARVTTGQIDAVIWESSGNVASSQTQVRKAKAALLHTLKKAGVSHILGTTNREIWIETEQLSCDYWQVLDGDVQVLNSYLGEYLEEYSWAEDTRVLLAGEKGRADSTGFAPAPAWEKS